MVPTDAAALRCVPLAFTLTAPTDIADLDLAQAVADALHSLERAETGERYPARADIVLSPEQSTAADLLRSGARPGADHRLVHLLGLVWARRAWDGEGAESSALMVDVRRAVSALCSLRWRTEDGVALLPVDGSTIMTAAAAGRLVKTTEPDKDLVLDDVEP